MAHLQHTDDTDLRRAAAGMDTAYEAIWRLRGRVAGVRTDMLIGWDSDSGRSICDHLETVEQALSQVGAQMSLVSELLSAHAALVQPTRDEVRTEIVRSYTEGPSFDATDDLGVILYPFFTSEQGLTDSLWGYGAIAPGEIPLPQPPQRPSGTWKTFLLGDDFPDYWFYVDENGDSLEEGEDAYGYDEWGDLVPAYQAVMPEPGYMQEAGIPIGPLLKLLGKTSKVGKFGTTASGARAIAPGADELSGLVRGSYGWRAEHIDRHIREYYGLSKTADVPSWMKDEFLKKIVDAGTRQTKVFQWRLRGETGGQPTASVLHYDQATKKWLVTQYYLTGERAGEFATAFAVKGRQLAQMLQQSAIG